MNNALFLFIFSANGNNISVSMDQQQRHTYLSAMGIAVWQRRKTNQPEQHRASLEPQQENKPTPSIATSIDNVSIENTLPPPSELITKSKKLKQKTSTPTATVPKPNANINYAALDWSNLQATVTDCQQCPLEKTRNQAISGSGSHNATLMIISDAPADDEDRQGLPFAGKTAQLLENMLHAIDIRQPDVYITNLVKCRPPNNRTPHKNELKQCEGFLQQQIALIKPELILVVGRIATQHLLKTSRSLAQLRHTTHILEQSIIPIIVTYHPAYLLRQTSAKAKAWQDLKQVQEQLLSIKNSRKTVTDAYTSS